MSIMEAISALLSSSAFGVALWYIINLRAKKKVEDASATKASAEANQIVHTAEQINADWIIEKIAYITEEQEKNNARYLKLERRVTRMIAIILEQDLYHCNRLSCAEKEPKLGEHHTTIPNTEAE